MALMDFVPVILFIVSAVVLQRGLYDRMSKGAFALFASGTIMIITAGFFKATWKLLLALEICDFDRLNQCFFPMQSVGFLLTGIALMGMVFAKQNELPAVAVFSGTFVFVSVMILGLIGMCTGLSVESKRKGKPLAMILFIVSSLFMLMMGYLSSKDFDKASMNWIAQGVNAVGQLLFLMGSLMLCKKQKA